ncbi:MAG: hypothetical protein ACHQ2E_09290 [Gemmatimonadales bacterium]
MSEPLGPWIDRHTAAAPAALRDRVAALTAPLRGRSDLASALAAVGRATVEQVIASSGDRREALNLLAADGLVTLSLLAQAQADPAGLASWSATLLRPVTEDV